MRQLVAAYLAVMALVTLGFAVLNARAAHPWITGEWLINYSGGFVRRGVLGELVLLLHRGTGVPLVGLVPALQLLVYAGFYASLIPLLRGVRWSLPLLALLLSPATLAFTVLDPPSSVRKEGLLFLSLSLLLHAARTRHPRSWQMVASLSVLAPLLVLSHEALFAFLPYLALPALLLFPLRQALRVLVLPAVLATAAFTSVLLHPGSRQQVAAICASVMGAEGRQGGSAQQAMAPGGVCSGAIAYLRMTPAEAEADASRAIHFYHYGTRYPLPILLTVLPIAVCVRRHLREGERREMLSAMAVVMISLAASLPLFVVARDWGRWVEIHAMCCMLGLLALERRSSLPGASSAAGPGQAARDEDDQDRLELPRAAGPRITTVLALALYATCWTLPAVGIFPGRFGYVDLVRYLHSYRARPHLTREAAGAPLP